MRGALALAVLSLVQGCAAAAVTLVDSAGKLAPSRELVSCAGRCGERAAIVSAIGSRGARKNSLLNKLFGTTFDTSISLKPRPPAVVAPSPGTIVINCDGVVTDAEAKLAALSTAVGDVIVMNIYRSDVGRCVAANTRALKSIFTQKLHAGSATADEHGDTLTQHKTLPLIVAVHDCDATADNSSLAEAVQSDLEAVWQEMGTEDSLSEHFNLQVAVLPHPTYQPEAYAEAVQALKLQLSSAAPSPLPLSGSFARRATNGWTAVRKAPPPPPGRAELIPVYTIESAHAAASSKVEGALKGWQAAVGKGRVVSAFGKKASALLQDTLRTYDAATASYSGTPLRAQRRSELVNVTETGIRRLFRQQIKMLAGGSVRAYKRELLALLNADKLTEEEDAGLLRKVLFDFESKATDLLPDAMQDLAFEDEYEELEGDLGEFSEKFGETAAVQLRALQKLEKQVAKPAGKEQRKRSIIPALHLVSLIRFPGQGNLNGFGGYRLGNHRISAGFMNDASLPESQTAQGRPPLIRLQPQLQLDVDL